MKTVLSAIVFITFAVSGSGCGLLFTNVKPVDEKSKNYRIAELDKENQDWVKLEPTTNNGSGPAQSSDISDIAYQSKQTSSIISLNSACRIQAASDSLDMITHELTLGVTDISQHEQKNIEVSGLPALQTTLQGKLGGEPMAMQTVVLKKESCTYDMIYVSRPNHFAEQQADFSHFVTSLHLK